MSPAGMNYISSTTPRCIGIFAGIALLASIAGCTDVPAVRSGLTGPIGGLTPPTAYLASISVSLSASTAQVGQSAKATVSGVDQYGKQFAPGVVTWSTTPDGIVSVNSDGVVTTIAEGVATVWANKAGIPPGSASIVVSR